MRKREPGKIVAVWSRISHRALSARSIWRAEGSQRDMQLGCRRRRCRRRRRTAGAGLTSATLPSPATRRSLQASGRAVVGPQSCRAGTAPAVRHEGSAVVELGVIGIVAGTPQGDRALAVIPALPERHGVMEFEPLAGRTAAPLAVAEGALPAVARPHRAPDRARNGPR